MTRLPIKIHGLHLHGTSSCGTGALAVVFAADLETGDVIAPANERSRRDHGRADGGDEEC